MVQTRCIHSEEAIKSKFIETLKKIETAYYHVLHPAKIYAKPGVNPEEIRRIFRPWDPSPNRTKSKTDEAKKLHDELKALKINITLLKLRERKALHVAKAILLNNNGWAPYSQNYYAGDWMLGPNLFCWEPICQVLLDLNAVISHFKPRNITELRQLEDLLKQHQRTFERYVENLKLGVRVGYVRSRDACNDGIHVMHYNLYRNIALGNETGKKQVFRLPFHPAPYSRELSAHA